MPINSFLYPAPSTPSFRYDVANSCRFDDGSSCQMRRASVDGGDQDKFTLSMWIKRGAITTSFPRLFTSRADGNDRFEIYFGSNDSLYIEGVDNGTATLMLNTNRKFRDPSAWFHFLLAVDTDQATASNRAKLWINGVQETSFATETYPSQDGNIGINTSSFPIRIGEEDASGVDFDGYLTEIVFLDGVQKTNTDFGEFDSDSPTIWKPIDVSDLSSEKGNNGFYLDFEDSSNLGNDVFGGTDFSVSNLAATDQSTDTCTNNFATWNPLNRNDSMGSFHHGNLEYEVDATFFRTAFATFGADQGKWYFECKRVIGTSFSIGIISLDYKNRTKNVSYIGGAGDATNNIGYLKDGNTAIGGSETSGYASYGNGDTVMVAMDIDNGKVYFGVNGTWGNSGDPTSGSTGTGARSFTPSGETWTFAVSVYDSHWEANFGSPMYSISSGNADDNGYGNFEYDVPAGFYSLCTKNLAEFG